MVAIPQTDVAPRHEAPPVRTIGPADLRASLADGYRDFLAKRGDMLFAGVFYPVIGFATAAFTLGTSTLYLLFPLLAGLSLLGPVVATGFYELARRREAGLEAGWSHFFDIYRSPRFEGIAMVGAGLFVVFLAWMLIAAAIWTAFMGLEPPASIGAMLREVFLTERGIAMAITGCAVGFGFAVLVLVTTVVALPMLVDRDVSPGEAVAASIAATRRNPRMVARWGLMVAVLLVLGAIPLLIGLAAVLPVLGYATWHLYTRLIDRDALERHADG